MRAALLLVCLVACNDKPKVQLVASSCADFASCSAECDRHIVVACDRGSMKAPDAQSKMTINRKGYEMWARTCDFGMPEACLNATYSSLRSRGQEPLSMSRPQIIADKEACEYFEIYSRASGTPLAGKCP